MSGLEHQLPTAVSSKPTAATLIQSIDTHIANFPSSLNAGSASTAEELDRHGMTLWNLCTKLKRGFDGTDKVVPPILLSARVLAYLLLDFATENGRAGPGSLSRIFKISIKAAKCCIGR